MTAQAQVFRDSHLWDGHWGTQMQCPAFRAKVEGRDPGDRCWWLGWEHQAVPGRPIRLVPGFVRPPCERGCGLWVLSWGWLAQELLQGKGQALRSPVP